MVLVLSRGGFCPKERGQHEGLVQLHLELEAAYCGLITITIDNIIETIECRSGVGGRWPFLSGLRPFVQRDLDIAESTDHLYKPMISHTIVLEPGLVVYRSTTLWFLGRPTIEDFRQDLGAVLKKCRPDWEYHKFGSEYVAARR